MGTMTRKPIVTEIEAFVSVRMSEWLLLMDYGRASFVKMDDRYCVWRSDEMLFLVMLRW